MRRIAASRRLANRAAAVVQSPRLTNSTAAPATSARAAPARLPAVAPRVAAVVVNYNGRDVTLQALASLSRMDYPAFDLVVLDNASTDDSVAAVASAFPAVLQVRVEENRGSASGYHAGF